MTDATPENNSSDFALKVFAGNLAFATTEEELKIIFSEAGKVTNAQIITRGTRSLGYGFVTFSTEAEAKKAIQILDKKEVAGRQLSVEGAKPITAAEAAERKTKSTTNKNKSKARTGETAARRPRTDEGEEGGVEASGANGAEGKQKGDGTSKSARRRQKKREAKARADGTEDETAAAAAEPNGASTNGAPKTKAPKPKRQPKGPPKGEPSKTLVFVANLAFETTDDKLKAAFSDFNVKSANVAKRNGSTRSKGFGFVDFADETEQRKAIESAQGREIDGRPVSLKVALQEDKSAEAASRPAESS